MNLFRKNVGTLNFQRIKVTGLGAAFGKGEVAKTPEGWIARIGSKESGWSVVYIPDSQHVLFEVEGQNG